jgi:hypothetical protein
METPRPTIQQVHLICATAMVAMATARKYFREDQPMRPSAVARIDRALLELGLHHLRRAPPTLNLNESIPK